MWVAGTSVRSWNTILEIALMGVFILAVMLALQELGDIRRFRMRYARQTNPRWRSWQSPWRGAFLWGVDLGIGITTQRPYGSIWPFMLLIALQPSAVASAAAGAMFGLGRSGPVWLGPRLARKVSSADLVTQLVATSERWRTLHGALLLLLGAVALRMAMT